MKEKHEIAIMTWHTYENYGTALQASALFKVIQSMGYAPALVDYLPKGSIPKTIKAEQVLKEVVTTVKKKLNHAFSSNYSSEERSKLFIDYWENRVAYTTKCASYPELHDLNSTYSAFVCGSDQIWSPLCYDSKYFLDFVENPGKMVAYAPSLGSSQIDNPYVREQMKRAISRFEKLSVREEQGADIIKELTGKTAKVVLDPTLLLTSEQWDSYAETQNTLKLKQDQYILCYFLGQDKKYLKYVERLSKKLDVPYYVIPTKKHQKIAENAFPFEIGPCEFVALIKNAAYVCTDSFHGIAFAINYNVPFTAFKRFKDNDPQNQNSRVFNILSMTGLEKRMEDYRREPTDSIIESCDYTEANKILLNQRDESLLYLKNALEAAIKNSNDTEKTALKITDMCCGCGACAAICNRGAVTIKKDEEGFERCFIDASKCVHCGRCATVCPMTSIDAPRMKESLGLYAVKSSSEEVLKTSSSGGTGYELAKKMLNDNYAVCGCAYESSGNAAKHIWIMPGEKDELKRLQGSKYIQSVSSLAMTQLVDIAGKRKAAFFGTPCQAAAADKLLRKNGLRDNVVIIDLICHGVPSYYLWDKYLKRIAAKYGTGDNPTVVFRSKERAWRRRLLLIFGNGNTYKREEHIDDFYAFFRRGLCYMKSCSDCPYRERSSADLRIGDFWGERYQSDKQGVSMVIANTKRGLELLEELKNAGACYVQKHELSEYWTVQFPFNSARPLIREELIEKLKADDCDVHSLRKEYCLYYDVNEMLSKMIVFAKKIVKGLKYGK